MTNEMKVVFMYEAGHKMKNIIQIFFPNDDFWTAYDKVEEIIKNNKVHYQCTKCNTRFDEYPTHREQIGNWTSNDVEYGCCEDAPVREIIDNYKIRK